MAGDARICNLALGHLGSGVEITNVETERSMEASACRLFYDDVLDEVTRDFPWPHARKAIELALVEEDPTDEWLFSYRYPTDCRAFRRIVSGYKTDNEDTLIPYDIASDDTGQLIYTDEEDAIGEYTRLITDPTKWPADFRLAFSYLLAARIAPRITAGDAFKLGPLAMQAYMITIEKAKRNALNEKQREKMQPSGFQRARGGR